MHLNVCGTVIILKTDLAINLLFISRASAKVSYTNNDT